MRRGTDEEWYQSIPIVTLYLKQLPLPEMNWTCTTTIQTFEKGLFPKARCYEVGGNWKAIIGGLFICPGSINKFLQNYLTSQSKCSLC
jgi:hypothetical protein